MSAATGDDRRAALMLDAGRPVEALRLAAPLAASGSASELTWAVVVRANLGLGRPAEAARAVRDGLAEHPESSWLHRLAAITFGHQGRWTPALGAADRAIELAPADWRTYLARVNLDLDPQVGVTSSTDDLVERMLELAPDEPEVHFAAGMVALRRREYGRAGKSFQRTLALDPQHAPAKNNLGVVRLRRSRVTSAARLFLAAKRNSPELEVARRNLAGAVRQMLRMHLAICVVVAVLFLGFMPAYGQRSLAQCGLAASLTLLDVSCLVQVRRKVGARWRFVLLDTIRGEPSFWILVGCNLLMLSGLVAAAALGLPGQYVPLGLMTGVAMFASLATIGYTPPGARRGRH